MGALLGFIGIAVLCLFIAGIIGAVSAWDDTISDHIIGILFFGGAGVFIIYWLVTISQM